LFIGKQHPEYGKSLTSLLSIQFVFEMQVVILKNEF